MWAYLVALTLVPRPCLPVELGRLLPPDPPAPLPAPVAPIPIPPPLAHKEQARYRITYGVLGQVGEITLAQHPPTDSGPARLVGQGRGAVLGLGQTEKSIATDFDHATGTPRSWTSRRVQGDKTVFDQVQQPRPGKVVIVRQRPGKADENDVFRRQVTILDPLAFIMRLRLDPPSVSQRFEVLDGHAYYAITVNPVRRDGKVLHFNGSADPIFWDGRPNPHGTARTFTLELADDPFHTPLRLVIPIGMGEVRADLIDVSRHDVNAKWFQGLDGIRQVLMSH